ncbi:MAG: hypothetical protein WBK67_03705 [Minisyncoccales bacterium]
MVEANIIQIVLTIIAVAVIGGMKFYERKYGSNPEAWDIQKFGMLIVVALAVMAAEYLYGNTIAFPAEDIIIPAMALFGTAYTLITGGKLVNNVVTPKVTGVSNWEAGFTATPSFSEGKSEFTQHFHMTSGSPAADHPGTVQIEIDWMDGTPKQIVDVKKNFAEVDHTFKYEQGESKYTGHSFYPEFTTISSDGTRKSFNTDGKFVEVEVQA